MKSVYIFGPIHLFGEDYLPIYKELNKLCSDYFEEVVGTYPDFWDSKETPQEFYERTYKTIIKPIRGSRHGISNGSGKRHSLHCSM